LEHSLLYFNIGIISKIIEVTIKKSVVPLLSLSPLALLNHPENCKIFLYKTKIIIEFAKHNNPIIKISVIFTLNKSYIHISTLDNNKTPTIYINNTLNTSKIINTSSSLKYFVIIFYLYKDENRIKMFPCILMKKGSIYIFQRKSHIVK